MRPQFVSVMSELGHFETKTAARLGPPIRLFNLRKPTRHKQWSPSPRVLSPAVTPATRHQTGPVNHPAFENQSYRASGLNLAIAAIVYWNTVYMERALTHLRSTGVAVPDHLLAHTSPLGWSHISLTGDYLWEQAAIAVDGFRPLNTSRSRLKLVA